MLTVAIGGFAMPIPGTMTTPARLAWFPFWVPSEQVLEPVALELVVRSDGQEIASKAVEVKDDA